MTRFGRPSRTAAPSISSLAGGVPRPRLGEGRYRFATIQQSPLRAIGQRLLIALALLTVVAAVTYIDRGGYVDSATGRAPDLLDSIYYATVSITTTGYGDIVPVTEGARLLTTLVVTPMR
ncbi:MAG TPA: ion channel, partial [Solirubrobacterales bacterium]|nr:ion channel [Solirubrobacterales bacterium]